MRRTALGVCALRRVGGEPAVAAVRRLLDVGVLGGGTGGGGISFEAVPGEVVVVDLRLRCCCCGCGAAVEAGFGPSLLLPPALESRAERRPAATGIARDTEVVNG